MKVISESFSMSTKGYNDMIDVTDEVNTKLASSGIQDGIVTLFVPGSTGGFTTIEHESGLVEDHAIGVSVTKRLYDFGYTRNQIRAASTEQAGQDWFYREAWHDHLLKIMRNYFDVLLFSSQPA